MSIEQKIKFVFICFCFSLLLGSCKKDPAIVDSALLSAQDTIEYHDIADTTFTSYNPDSVGTTYSASVSFPLDADGDSIVDFNLFSYNYYSPPSTGGPGSFGNTNYFCGITGVDSSDFVTFISPSTNPLPVANVLSSGNIVDNSLSFNKSGYMYAVIYNIGWYYYPSYTDRYVGFKIKRNGNDYFGWFLFSNVQNTLTFKSWAINRTAGNSINAGQTI